MSLSKRILEGYTSVVVGSVAGCFVVGLEMLVFRRHPLNLSLGCTVKAKVESSRKETLPTVKKDFLFLLSSPFLNKA